MATLKIFFFVLLIQCTVFTGSSRQLKNSNINIDSYGDNTFNVISFGAIGDGKKDDSKGFKRAWDAACDSSTPSPTFLIDGRIIAPTKPSTWECNTNCHHWIGFQNFDGLHIQGSGTINGQGDNWWKLSCKDNQKSCQLRKPTGFMIGHSKNVDIKGLTFEDSPKMHIAFEDSTSIHATQLTIKAPGNSPNTDGIHIQRSTNVSIHNTTIQTGFFLSFFAGDDCISIGDGSKYINITNIECGPGHGISIGSLGIMGKTEEVEFVHVRNVSFHGTTNGVRIKTWQGGHGHRRNIRFEDITSHASTRPIVIDQYYCPHKQCKNQTSAVEISNIAYENINGTSHKETAVQFSCSESSPCRNITMKNINLRNEKQKGKTSSIASMLMA
ncbi:putative polygalacturonase [Gossypium australe]|uniref:Putative polygalacturonase n=1 Tax=Gossypium australe TaxID=47621 RepID=A0A5B6UGR5_9ROSI|nr:putative polygalacturonase [Gossypium australe]